MISQVALAPLAGVVVATLGSSWAFWINSASYVVSALVLRRLAVPVAPAPIGRGGWFGEAREGLQVLGADRVLRGLAAGQFLAALSAGATSALLVLLAAEHLGVAAGGYGLLLGAIGVGAALGPILLARVTDDPRRPAAVFGSFLLRGGVDAVLATVTGLAAAMAALVGYGLGTSIGAVTFNSFLQATSPEQFRGRVFAAFDMLWQSGRLLSLLVGGLVADTAGIRAVYYLGGALLVLAAVVGWRAVHSASPAAGTAGRAAPGRCARRRRRP